MVLSDAEKGYLAGFLDGEGCIGLGCRSFPAKCRLYTWVIFGHFDNTNEKAIYHIYNVLQKLVPEGWTKGKGYIQSLKPNKWHKRPMYRITMSSRLLRLVLLEIQPYLIVKKRQAELILEAIPILSSNRGAWKKEMGYIKDQDTRLRKIYEEIRSLNLGSKHRSAEHLVIDFLKCEK